MLGHGLHLTRNCELSLFQPQPLTTCKRPAEKKSIHNCSIYQVHIDLCCSCLIWVALPRRCSQVGCQNSTWEAISSFCFILLVFYWGIRSDVNFRFFEKRLLLIRGPQLCMLECCVRLSIHESSVWLFLLYLILCACALTLFPITNTQKKLI